MDLTTGHAEKMHIRYRFNEQTHRQNIKLMKLFVRYNLIQHKKK